MFKTWLTKTPLNMVLLLWIVCVTISGALLFFVMTGMLNRAIPRKSQRDVWFEVNNQILNALFTLMCLYQHPKRFYHLVLLCRWTPKDITSLRKAYCKHGAYLSLFCSFCVFGWNMERLGFGNMYVHIATFLLFCSAPFWIFNMAAVNIDNDTARSAMGLVGVVLCVFGMLYGGFWRIQMRKRFNLSGNEHCCGNPDAADCAQWLFCCWCSLAQEVRTADFYDVVENKFIMKHQPGLSPLSREGFSSSASNQGSRVNYSTGRPVVMEPPVLSGIRRDDETQLPK
ncbi:hypothetical protein LINGRAHAP2_LOCUS17244 [Linum grandiflorum]